ncbi:hypothetical protein BKA67DRAFT_542437 [Truncatella angustata]|uniref:Uncharacterized protein n=1 Tax=Truncatella angustata TaxID=152316 RepID=A0A9P8RF66_9PEZI|nr:uncharacterized protein BKA67DRAFT_542437 [Truncatella angustata]KAH6643487.1 hypothetical protein BKA67DRAFT_542437 [Truncatella angustata]
MVLNGVDPYFGEVQVIRPDESSVTALKAFIQTKDPSMRSFMASPSLKEKSLVRGALLANNVGTGKTITVISLIILHYFDLCKKKAVGEAFKARPTCLQVTVGLIGQTIDELFKHFGGLIDILSYYGSPGEFKGIRATITSIVDKWTDWTAETSRYKTVTGDPRIDV